MAPSTNLKNVKNEAGSSVPQHIQPNQGRRPQRSQSRAAPDATAPRTTTARRGPVLHVGGGPQCSATCHSLRTPSAGGRPRKSLPSRDQGSGVSQGRAITQQQTAPQPVRGCTGSHGAPAATARRAPAGGRGSPSPVATSSSTGSSPCCQLHLRSRNRIHRHHRPPSTSGQLPKHLRQRHTQFGAGQPD